MKTRYYTKEEVFQILRIEKKEFEKKIQEGIIIKQPFLEGMLFELR